MTSSLLFPTLGLLAGFVLLVVSADRFVEGASALAGNLGISPLMVGLLIVGFGTSAPEMLVSATAAWEDKAALAIGNAAGSNIANIGLILGVAALVRPLTVHSQVLRRELPVPLIAMLFALVLLEDGRLSRLDGIFLFTGFGVLVYWMVNLAVRQHQTARPAGTPAAAPDVLADEFAGDMPQMTTRRAVFWLVMGMLVLLGASRLLVWSAVEIATWWGLSEMVIGLTIVSVGTGLPELAAAISAVLKNKADIAIGNVVGSNTFNILAVLGIAGVIRPGPFEPELLTRDFPVMIGLSLALFAMAYGLKGHGRINRVEGALLVLAYCGYVGYLLTYTV